MLDLILFEPEIPPNTGNIIRLCANTGMTLHLVGRLGFTLSDARLRRAGLDYHEWVSVRQHAGLSECLDSLGQPRVFALSTRGAILYSEARFRTGDALLFGPEQRGLPAEILAGIPVEQRLRIPMRAGSRSLNLSNAAAVIGYEAWRQLAFAGAG